MKNDNVVKDKSYGFALRIVELYKYLAHKKNEFVLSKQILRCGTSIGANIEEAIGGQTEKDFYAKISVAYKETRETSYWLRLLKDSAILENKIADSLLKDCDELLRIIGSIQLTIKKRNS